MGEIRGLMLRLPASLHIKLVREAGEKMAQTGKRMSLNHLIVEILEAHFEGREKRRVTRR
jgi:hypothetical protein